MSEQLLPQAQPQNREVQQSHALEISIENLYKSFDSQDDGDPKFKERLTAQFRAEFFKVLMHLQSRF